MDELVLQNGRRTTRVAFGCGGLGGSTGWKRSRGLLVAAWDAGIRHFDVAPSYGFGEAEQFLGRALKEFGGAATVTTKVGIGRGSRPGKLGQILRHAARAGLAAAPAVRRKLGTRLRAAAPRGQFAIGFVRTSVEESLRALGRDHVDVLLLHEALGDDLSPELLDLLSQLQREGMIGAAGIGSRAESLTDIAQPFPAPLCIAQSVWRLDGRHFAALPGTAMNRYGVMRNLSQFRTILQAHPGLAAQWSEQLSLRLPEPQACVNLLMSMALSEAQGGMVIAQSRDPKRVTEMASVRPLQSAAETLAMLRGLI